MKRGARLNEPAQHGHEEAVGVVLRDASLHLHQSAVEAPAELHELLRGLSSVHSHPSAPQPLLVLNRKQVPILELGICAWPPCRWVHQIGGHVGEACVDWHRHVIVVVV